VSNDVNAGGRREGVVDGEARPAAETTIHVSVVETGLGPMVAAATDAGLCLLEYASPGREHAQIEAMRRHVPGTVVRGRHPHVDHVARELTDYFAARLTTFTVPIVAPGTPFQEKVWHQLLAIPYGQTRSYEEIAHAAGTPQGMRAVGLANGSNRLAIVIPCHRVINKSGRLGGYGGELWRKQRLLQLEQGLPLF